jgi:maleate cis-trans isomerase
MKGRYASRVSLEEKIAAEVETFRLESHSAASLRNAGVARVRMLTAYPAEVYRPSEAFLRRMLDAGKPRRQDAKD